MAGVGDVVRHCAIFSSDIDDLGIVIEVEVWRDEGAPDRNFGCLCHVYWMHGSFTIEEEDTLEVVSHAKPS